MDVKRWTFDVNFVTNSALLLVGHGSTVNPASSAPTLAHARTLRDRKIFAEVACAFWKEEPSLRDALAIFRDSAIREVYVVPNFISEGYFTRTVIPRELELSGPVTFRENGQVWKYCAPAGSHPAMTDLLLRRAREVAPGIAEDQTSLLIVGHGTSLNDNSAAAAKWQAETIRQMGRYASVQNVYMEEPPLVSDWARLTDAPNVVVVPFFISDGLHSDEDIPVLLGIESQAGDVARQNPCRLHGRSLYYAGAIGTDPGFPNLILDLVESFARQNEHLYSPA